MKAFSNCMAVQFPSLSQIMHCLQKIITCDDSQEIQWCFMLCYFRDVPKNTSNLFGWWMVSLHCQTHQSNVNVTMNMIALVKEVRNDIREKKTVMMMMVIVCTKMNLKILFWKCTIKEFMYSAGGKYINIILCLHVKRSLNETKTFWNSIWSVAHFT